MAWLSVGTSNADLIQKMIQNEVFEEGPILEAFRVTDRGDFVNPEDRILAYSDRPVKRGFIHISAPHMYATVLKALDLKSGKSFLNVGSGSGYLSCLAAFLLGEEGVSHGVEVSEEATQFSREKAKLWHAKLLNKLKEDEESLGTPMPSVISADGIAFVRANCFDIDVLSAVSTMKYDRIYIGAGCPEARKEFFLSMLADNGILVAPINEKNQMIVIRKFCGRVYNSKPISQVNFAPLVDTTVRADEEALLAELASMESTASLNSDIQHTVQKVQAAAASSSFIFHPLPFNGSGDQLLHHSSGSGSGGSSPAAAMLSATGVQGVNNNNNSNRTVTEETVVRVRLPALVWAPLRRRHLQFPPDFRKAVYTILLANNQSFQPSPYNPYMQYTSSSINTNQQQFQLQQHYHRAGPAGRAWSCLPHHIWLYIFTFASRDWFCVPKSEVQTLSTELAVERRLRRTAEDKLRKAEAARRAAEHEREMYKIALARLKQQNKYNTTTGTAHGTGSLSAAAAAAHAAMWTQGEDESEESEYGDFEEEEDDEGFEHDGEMIEGLFEGDEEEEEGEEEEEDGEAEWDETMDLGGEVGEEGEEVGEGEVEVATEVGSVTISDGGSDNGEEEEGQANFDDLLMEQDQEQPMMVVDGTVAVVGPEVASPHLSHSSHNSSSSHSSASFQSATEEPPSLHTNGTSNGNDSSGGGMEVIRPSPAASVSDLPFLSASAPAFVPASALHTNGNMWLHGESKNNGHSNGNTSNGHTSNGHSAPNTAAAPAAWSPTPHTSTSHTNSYFYPHNNPHSIPHNNPHNHPNTNHSANYNLYQQLQGGGNANANANANAVARSLSSDATCTTVESAFSSRSSDPVMAAALAARNHTSGINSGFFGAARPPLPSNNNNNISANGNGNGNGNSNGPLGRAAALSFSFSTDERISDCTDASSSHLDLEGGNEGEEGDVEVEGEDSGFDTSEQFATDELL